MRTELIFCARRGCGTVLGSVELADDAPLSKVRQATAGYLCDKELDMRPLLAGTSAEEAIRRTKRTRQRRG